MTDFDLSSLSPDQLAELQKKLAAEKAARRKAFEPTRLSHVVPKGSDLLLRVPLPGGDSATIPATVSRTSVVEPAKNPDETPIRLVVEIHGETAEDLLRHAKDAAVRASAGDDSTEEASE